MTKTRPKIGVALSGASGRAVAHIGVLEVLEENGIPIDYITACSSGTIIAGSYACGTMQELKSDLFKIDRKFILSLFGFSKTGSGLFNFDKAIDWFNRYLGDKKFEEVRPYLGFTCMDIIRAEPFLLNLGSLAKAGQASCAVPGLFEPVQWGNRWLIDGGIFSLVPTEQAYQMGADIVIGVDIAATRYMYKKPYIKMWRGVNYIRNPIRKSALLLKNAWNGFFKNSLKIDFYSQSDFLKNDLINENPDLFTVLAKAMDIAAEQHKKGQVPACDVMIAPNVKRMGKIDTKQVKNMYEEGRRAAAEAVPDILKILQNYEWRSKYEKTRRTKLKLKEI